MIFSPKPMSAYARENKQGLEEGFGTSLLLMEPGVWNLFWLSEPLADASETWPMYDTDNLPKFSELMWPCSLTCRLFPAVTNALETLTATEFIVALKGMDYRSMPLYQTIGEGWIETMEVRAGGHRGVMSRTGNVLDVNFLGAKLRRLEKSATIMSMSLTRH